MSKKIFLIIFLLVILIITQITPTVYSATIDTTKKASLKIIEYENAYGEGNNSLENKPLNGVEVTIYKVDAANFNNSAQKIEQDLADKTINLVERSLVTGPNGTITFTNLPLGRYLVVQTYSPKNVNVKMESFLIDLPRTSNNGTSWDYDVTVEPKNITVYGNVLLTKKANNNQALQGTTWELQYKDKQNTWQKYNYNGTLTTDSNGQISVNNLPAGDYRFVETSTLEGYILDSSNVKEFSISSSKTSTTLTATNDKPIITKQVKSNTDYVNATSSYIADETMWKISSTIPSMINKLNTFYITDSLPNGIDFISNSFEVYAKSSNDSTKLSLGTDYNLTQSENSNKKSLKLEFTPSKLKNYSSIEFTYKTKFNSTVKYGQALTNGATLTYTNSIDVNGKCLSTYTTKPATAEIHIGALVVLKTDIDGNPLAGAKFKISKTKQDAKSGTYIKGIDGKDLIATSNSEGLVTFYGLKYGNENVLAKNAYSTYYITEIESPTYEENGEIKHYNLLSDSVEVVVNSSSGEKSNNTPQIVNKKGFILPTTGAIGTISLMFIGNLLILITLKWRKQNEENQN